MQRYTYVSFPNRPSKRRKTSLQAVSSKPHYMALQMCLFTCFLNSHLLKKSSRFWIPGAFPLNGEYRRNMQPGNTPTKLPGEIGVSLMTWEIFTCYAYSREKH